MKILSSRFTLTSISHTVECECGTVIKSVKDGSRAICPACERKQNTNNMKYFMENSNRQLKYV